LVDPIYNQKCLVYPTGNKWLYWDRHPHLLPLNRVAMPPLMTVMYILTTRAPSVPYSKQMTVSWSKGNCKRRFTSERRPLSMIGSQKLKVSAEGIGSKGVGRAAVKYVASIYAIPNYTVVSDTR
jgi:hypothetical protein